MAAVVQVQCPHCRQALRVPADWVGRTLRCKHCQNGFQARAGVAASSPKGAASGTAPHPGVAAGPPPQAQLPDPAAAAAQQHNPNGAKRSPRHPEKSSRRKVILIGAIILVVVGVTGAGLAVTVGPRIFGRASAPETTAEGPGPGSKTEGANKEAGTKWTPRPVPPSGHYFPRRALLIGVSNYLFANPLNYGFPRKESYPGSSINTLRDQFARPPMNIPNLQIVELSDGGRTPHPPVKSVIEMAITDFLNTARSQDRLIILFAGHAVELEEKIYLAPLEANLTDAQTLIPLQWVYDKLAQCQARQKVLIVDVCRFAPERGFEMPGGGDAEGRMTGTIEDKLLSPPAGVQVWMACAKDQQSIELYRGSVFLQALCAALQERVAGISNQGDPFPLEMLLPKVNQRLKDVLDPLKMVQTAVLAGKEAGGAPYNANEPLAQVVTLKSPSLSGGKAIDLAVAKAVVDELNLIPPGRGPPLGQLGLSAPLDFRFLPPAAIHDMEDYRADGYTSIKDLENIIQAKPGQYALRKAFLEAGRVIKESDSIRNNLRDNLLSMDGGFNDDFKETLLKEQEEVTKVLAKLKETLAAVKKAGAEHALQEKSKRWQANYEFALARLMTRVLYLAEYSSMIDNARSDRMPELQPFHNGWRIGAAKAVNCQEDDIQPLVNTIPEMWQKIQKDYPGTPWAVIGQRETLPSLGMEWKPARD